MRLIFMNIHEHPRIYLLTKNIPFVVKMKLYPKIGVPLGDKRPIAILLEGDSLLKQFNGWMRGTVPNWKDL